MALSSVGLYTHIRNNTIKSIVLVALYPVLITAVAWLIALVADMLLITGRDMNGKKRAIGQQFDAAINGANAFIWQYWPVLLTIVIIWFIIAYFMHNRMIGRIAHARPVTRADMPELYNMLENLCIAEGMTMPQLNIIETHARNAFTSGIKPGNYAITVTRGLVRNLQADEVEAVLGHELTHIKNGDVRLIVIAVVFTGMLGLAAQLVWSHLRFAIFIPKRGRRDGRIMIFVLAIGAILGLGYLMSLVMRFAISRKREYMADAGAVEMAKKPDAMMRALMRITGRDQLKQATAGISQMCIENTHPFLGIFSSHPTVDSRIAALSNMTNTSVPDVARGRSADRNARFESTDTPHDHWLSRERRNRKTGKRNPWQAQQSK